MGTRAASAPSARPNSASGNMRRVIRLATHSADWVCSYVNTAYARISSQRISDTSMPTIHSLRNCGSR